MTATTRILVQPDPVRALDTCLQELADFSQSQSVRRAFLLVPEEAKADTERRYMEEFDRRGLMLAEVVSFRRLAYRLLSEAGGLAQKRLGDNGKALVLTRILQSKAEAYPYLGKLAGKANYAAELSQIMGDFTRYGWRPQDLDQVLDRAHLSRTSRAKLQDLARLQRDFLAAKEQLGVTDGDQDLSRLCQLLRQDDNPRLAFLGQTRIWLAGFGLVRAFTPQEREVLIALADRVESLTLALSPAGLGPQGQVQNRDLVASSSFAHYALREMQAALPGSRSYFVEAQGKRKIQLWQSSNSQEELAAAAGEIKLLVSQGHYRKRDIAVALCRSEDLDRAAVIFADFGLDPYIASARPLEESPLYRYLDLFGRLAGGQAKPQDLVALAHTGLVTPDPATDHWLQALDAFENFLLASPARFLSDLSKAWLYKRTEAGPAARDFYQTYLAPQVTAAQGLRSVSSGRDKALYLLAWLDEQGGIRQHLETWIQDLHRAGASERALLLASSWEAVLASLEEVADLLGPETLSQADFQELLLSSLRGKRPQGIPLGLDRIRLASPQQLLLYPAKVLFILGATRTSFPGPAPAEGLLHNAEREELATVGERALPNYRRDTVQAGRALTHYLALRGQEALYLSCPSLDEEDLSDFQLELAHYLDQEQKASKALQAGKGTQTDKAPQDDEEAPLAAGEHARLCGPETDLGRQEFAATSYPDQRWLSLSRARRYLAGRLPSPQGWEKTWQKLLAPYQVDLPPDPLAQPRPQIYLPADLTQDLLGQIKTMSVSRLQSFNTCPYQHFAQYILGLQERDRYQPLVTHNGSFLHALLEHSLQDLLRRLEPHRSDLQALAVVLDRWKQEISPAYVGDIYRTLSQTDLYRSYREPLIQEVQGRRLSQKALAALRQETQDLQVSGYLPRLLEWSFPQAQDRQPLSLLLAGQPVVLRGQIDRIDLDGAGRARLLDYKSGSHTLNAVDLLTGKQLQLPLYARVWETSLSSGLGPAYGLGPSSGLDLMTGSSLTVNPSLTVGPGLTANPADQAASSPGYGQVAELTLENLAMAPRRVLAQLEGQQAQVGPQRSSLVADKFPLQTLSSYALSYSQELLNDLGRGQLSPQPLSTDKLLPCQTYCPYQAICRFEEQMGESRARRLELKREEERNDTLLLGRYLDAFTESGLLAPQLLAQEQEKVAWEHEQAVQAQGQAVPAQVQATPAQEQVALEQEKAAPEANNPGAKEQAR